MDEKSPLAYRTENNIGIIELDNPDSKVNILTFAVMQKLGSVLDEVSKNSSLRALLIVSKKKDVFVAGADIKEIESITKKEEGEEKSKAGHIILNKLEDLKIPSIAVIDGVALGGGCELALACRFRVATFNEKISIGLPEVKLGILPGFAGTYRLPKVVGMQQALKMILTGKILSAQEALKCGLIDKIFPQKALENGLKEFIAEAEKSSNKRSRAKPKKGMDLFLEETLLGRMIMFNQTRKMTMATAKGFYPAPLKALDVIEKSQGLPRAKALELEAKAFGELVVTGVSKNLIHLFYLSEKYKKLVVPGTENISPKTIARCGILGAGVMGGGIAHLLSSRGVWVRLKDINYDAIKKGFQAAYKVYRDEVKKRRIKPFELTERMGRISGSLTYEGFKNLDMIIEAVVENMDVKKKVFKELSEAASSQTILCTNTSALSVTEMAKATKDPSKVIGLHFFNPVHRMPLIEIIYTELTSPETLAATVAFTKRLGKTPVVVKDSCGFLVNRILLSCVNEGGRILEEGEGIEDVDSVMTNFGMPMGPFELSDEVGLDVGIKVLHILENAFGERFKPVEIFEKVFAKGLLGKKSKKGFYIHKKEKIANPEIYTLLSVKNHKESKRAEYLKRMLYIMINEAARCLEEKVIESADDVDIGMIMGTGFPPFRGGLLRYADSVGAGKIVDDLRMFAGQYKAERFTPCTYLVELKNKNQGFYKK